MHLRSHSPARASLAKRLAQGLTKREIIRCLKRFVAREIYAYLYEPNGASMPACDAEPPIHVCSLCRRAARHE